MMNMTPDELRTNAQALPTVPVWEQETYWGKKRIAMRDHFLNNDPVDILCWSTVSATMFVGEYQVTLGEVEELKKTPRWEAYARTALMEERFGNPPSMVELAYTSGNLIHQTHHLWQWERVTSKAIEDAATIIEFGGGYGAMCAIARRLGFRGDYYLVDLPEMTLLQEFYLSNIGFEAKYVPCDSTTDFRSVLPRNADVFIALHSLSEAPIPVRGNVMDAITPVTWLFSFQGKFFNIDNYSWFRSLVDKHKGYEHNFFTNEVNTNINYLVSYMKGIKV